MDFSNWDRYWNITKIVNVATVKNGRMEMKVCHTRLYKTLQLLYIHKIRIILCHKKFIKILAF